MAGFMKMVSMERTEEEKAVERARDTYPPAIADMPDIPYGLSICLTEVELEKLNLDDEIEVGDMIHLSGMAKCTSISKNDTGNGTKVRAECGFVMLSAENEEEENEPRGRR